MTREKKNLGTQGRADILKGKAKQAAGKVESKAGEVLGDEQMEARGNVREGSGKAQAAMGKGKQKVDKTLRADKPTRADNVES